MPEPSASPYLTFEAVARALAEVDIFCEPRSWDRARRLGISVDHLRSHYEIQLVSSRPPADIPFWHRWMLAHSAYTSEDPITWAIHFVRHEFRRFCHPPTARASLRHQLLSTLTDVQTLHPASAAVRLRLLELCFFPGVLFPWVTAHATFAQLLQPFLYTLRTNLKAHAHDCKTLEPYFVNRPVARQYRLLVRTLQKVCQDVENVFVSVETWKKNLGLTRKLSVHAQGQQLWTPLFVEVVDLLRPFCSGRKQFHLADPGTMPEEVFDLASRLMALSQPMLWKDTPRRVKARYFDYRAEHPRVDSPPPPLFLTTPIVETLSSRSMKNTIRAFSSGSLYP